jgi:phosphoribosylanthranilate isomerase
MTRIKICGITRVEDALFAARQGADAIGLVFYPASPRHVSVARAREIIRALPPFVTTVGLFVNALQHKRYATYCTNCRWIYCNFTATKAQIFASSLKNPI